MTLSMDVNFLEDHFQGISSFEDDTEGAEHRGCCIRYAMHIAIQIADQSAETMESCRDRMVEIGWKSMMSSS